MEQNNPNSISSAAKPFSWTHEYLVKLIGMGNNPIVTDPILLNAFRAIDRQHFVHDTLKDVAHQDKIIDLGFGEVMTNPTTIAKQLQIFDPKYGGRYLHLGSGTGYVSAILAYVAGDKGKVYAMERIQWLWEQARSAILNYPELKNLEILYRDGSAGLPDKGPFDGILYSYALESVPQAIIDQLANGGRIVAPVSDNTLRLVTKDLNGQVEEEIIHGFAEHVFKREKAGRA